MHETKYATMLVEHLLQQGMGCHFETMYRVNESLHSMVHFYSICIDVYYFSIFIILTNVYTLIIVYFIFGDETRLRR